MSDPLVLTFAEVEFVIASCPVPPTSVRGQLRFAVEPPAEQVVASGLASLLARGLCSVVDGAVVPGPEVVLVAAGFVEARSHTAVAGWNGEVVRVMDVFSSPGVRLAVQTGGFGRYGFEVLDRVEPLSRPVTGFLDQCARVGAATVVVRSVSAEREVAFAITVDDAGTWHVSDSVRSPDRGIPCSSAEARYRIVELLDAPVVPWARAGG